MSFTKEELEAIERAIAEALSKQRETGGTSDRAAVMSIEALAEKVDALAGQVNTVSGQSDEILDHLCKIEKHVGWGE